MSTKYKDLRVDDRDWTKLTFGEQVKMLEIEGYVVLPDVISESKIKACHDGAFKNFENSLALKGIQKLTTLMSSKQKLKEIKRK